MFTSEHVENSFITDKKTISFAATIRDYIWNYRILYSHIFYILFKFSGFLILADNLKSQKAKTRRLKYVLSGVRIL